MPYGSWKFVDDTSNQLVINYVDPVDSKQVTATVDYSGEPNADVGKAAYGIMTMDGEPVVAVFSMTNVESSGLNKARQAHTVYLFSLEDNSLIKSIEVPEEFNYTTIDEIFVDGSTMYVRSNSIIDPDNASEADFRYVPRAYSLDISSETFNEIINDDTQAGVDTYAVLHMGTIGGTLYFYGYDVDGTTFRTNLYDTSTGEFFTVSELPGDVNKAGRFATNYKSNREGSFRFVNDEWVGTPPIVFLGDKAVVTPRNDFETGAVIEEDGSIRYLESAAADMFGLDYVQWGQVRHRVVGNYLVMFHEDMGITVTDIDTDEAVFDLLPEDVKDTTISDATVFENHVLIRDDKGIYVVDMNSGDQLDDEPVFWPESTLYGGPGFGMGIAGYSAESSSIYNGTSDDKPTLWEK